MLLVSLVRDLPTLKIVMSKIINQAYLDNLPDATIVAFCSKFDIKNLSHWKHLIRKPLHYVIQGFTGSRMHHSTIIQGGMLQEALDKYGVRTLTLRAKIKEVDRDTVFLKIFEPATKLTIRQKGILKADLQGQLGKKYSALQAVYSAIDRILFFNLFKTKTRNSETFCAKYVFIAYQNIYTNKLHSIEPERINPEELIKTLSEKGLIKSGINYHL